MINEYVWFNDLSQQFLENGYLLPGQTVDQRVDEICGTAAKILGKPIFANQFKDNLKKGWYSLSTPVWTNFGTKRGMPISCFTSYIGDSITEILYGVAEVGQMTKIGGGTAAYFGDVRGRGELITDNGTSSGTVHFMGMFDKLISTISQGNTRRGNFAAYLPVDHKDILEFLTIKSKGNPIQDILFGVCIPEGWMQSMIDGDSYKRKVWAKILECRNNLGVPYISFIDNLNNNAPDVYKSSGRKILCQNLCNEIALNISKDESFVCCLSSMNILYYDKWKDTNAVELMIQFLDTVMSEFIEKAESIQFLERALNFAKNQRALGLGWLGWHSYLQKNMIPWESMDAKYRNIEIAKTIKKQSLEASQKMAKEYGEPELLKGIGRRHTTLCSIAPTKSSSFILGQVSEGIEPYKSNYYIKDLAKGKFTIKNPYLEELLKEKCMDSEVIWQSILKHSGSVQHLDFLNQQEKNVFKTFQEISPKEIIIQAAQRQKYIDQSQSLNLMIHPSTPIKDVNALIIEAWRLGIKSLYYQFSVSAAKEFAKDILNCTSCEA